MRVLNSLIVPAFAAALLFSTTAHADSTPSDEDFARLDADMSHLIDGLTARDDFAPGAIVVIVTADGRRWMDIHGVLSTETGASVAADSQFYIASMTKAYMGLLAAHLHQEGILSLDTTLDDHWPGLALPEGVSAADITLRDLITHQIAIENGQITGTEAYIRDLSPSEYRRYLEEYSEPREPGFQYDNLGYNIYGAVLEMHTGRNWRDWLDEVIFAPNGMDGTSGRVSDFDPAHVAWGHQMDTGIAPFWPQAEGWHLIYPKTDGMMQAAGGLMTTADDLATWLVMNLQQTDAGDISPAAFEAAHRQWVAQEGDGHGFTDDGYSFGWNVGRLIHEGTRADGTVPADTHLLQHGGGYTGYGSLMTIAPDLGIGVAVAVNADGPLFFSALEITKHAIESVLGIEGLDERAAERIDAYARIVARVREIRVNRMAETLSHERFGDGGWAPDMTELAQFTGHYESTDWIDALEITLEDGNLRGRVHDLRRYIRPVSTDIFAVYGDAASAAEIMRFHRDDTGAITSITWDDDELVRVQR